MRRTVGGTLLVGWLLAALCFPQPAEAHMGAPYPVLMEQAVGPYTVSALADPDVGVGTFIIEVTLAGGEPPPEDTVLTLSVVPDDGHAEEATYQAERTLTRDGERFIGEVPFDVKGFWSVRLALMGPAGEGETSFQVRVTPPGPGWVETLLCLIPFVLVAILWLLGARRKRRAAAA
jgi:hypothetical protein